MADFANGHTEDIFLCEQLSIGRNEASFAAPSCLAHLCSASVHELDSVILAAKVHCMVFVKVGCQYLCRRLLSLEIDREGVIVDLDFACEWELYRRWMIWIDSGIKVRLGGAEEAQLMNTSERASRKESV
jgi:hypothetical protein